ncbi:MAG: A24 family peptidase C-terminal domain-containing protein [Methanosarcinaceae archaeon]|nr:A24 family peptidase C-terminal domain-containing protein [Methanosarcinaceae archaeon]MDD4749907.1 A24 family peptidase C-terminal domain-containing protein [Methanosarcinaceae archaeon]
MIEILKILFCLPFLFYSCYTDLKSRNISNRLWKSMLASGSGFVLYELFFGALPPLEALKALLLSSGLVFLSVYILFQLGAFGGGDAKGLIVLSILFPSYPTFELLGQTYPFVGLPPIGLFTFTVLGNALLLTIIVPLGMFGYNLLHYSSDMLQKPYYMFIGYKTPIATLKEKEHLALLEKFEETEKGQIKRKHVRAGLNFEINQLPELETYAKKGLIEDKVWVTPGLPFMLSITAGFLVAVLFGDLIFYLILLFIQG